MTLIDQLKRNEKLFYIITNTRAMEKKAAEKFTIELMNKLNLASRFGTRQELQMVSRGDSTLRGHFPLEVNSICSTFPQSFDGIILAPAFFEGGRITVDDIHYLQEGDMLTPVADTPFAKDPHFSYESSDLKNWIKEKYGGAEGVINTVSISLEDIRRKGPYHIANVLSNVPPGPNVIIVNGKLQLLTSGDAI
jgi:uncharacterized protein YgbK (DUF1537 family)